MSIPSPLQGLLLLYWLSPIYYAEFTGLDQTSHTYGSITYVPEKEARLNTLPTARLAFSQRA